MQNALQLPMMKKVLDCSEVMGDVTSLFLAGRNNHELQANAESIQVFRM